MGVVLRPHPVRGESHIQRNANGEVATQLLQHPENPKWFSIISVTIFEVNFVDEQKQT